VIDTQPVAPVGQPLTKPLSPRAYNGQRVHAIFNNFAGDVGYQVRNGKAYVAFWPTNNNDIGRSCLINDRAHKIVEVEKSATVTGMLVVEVEDIQDAEVQ
jgi:hypothetical protein